MADEDRAGENQALLEWLQANYGVGLLTLPGGAMAATLPSGISLKSIKPLIDEYRGAPERREGTARLHNLDSFIAHANRFKDADSLLFAMSKPPAGEARAIENPALVSMLDYHKAGPEGLPRFGRHRGEYVCPFSDGWRSWAQAEGSKMPQAVFAEFIEDRIGDLMAPPTMSDAAGDVDLIETATMLGGQFCQPAELMALARGITIRADDKIRQAVSLATGEVEIIYQTEHGEAGERLRVRNLFVLALPVFQDGPTYRLIGRLRYRIAAGALTWHYQLWRADRVFRHAFDEVCATAAEKTGLAILRGQPEGFAK